MSAAATETGAVVVYVTVPDAATGKALARGLVEGQLAACVNIIPGAGLCLNASSRGILQASFEADCTCNEWTHVCIPGQSLARTIYYYITWRTDIPYAHLILQYSALLPLSCTTSLYQQAQYSLLIAAI